ncbi:Protein XRP2 [Toxocara canis]|uniref:Protein XRP2 n=1 Tax=Toxocara canis TaxID=6265 RepID=A0A0B2VKT6_TOXCA|nr:Protein XRP2 [Toxocara canis]
MSSLRLCCPKKRHVDREEQYHVKDEEPPKYSWEKERPDPSHYQFTKLYGEVVAKLDGHIAGQQFIIDKCKESCILILDHTASVNIDDCEKCLIVLGPCKGRSVCCFIFGL